MTASSRIPRYLFQVLEEEFEALHGELPSPDSPDWKFTERHIKDADYLVAVLGLAGDTGEKDDSQTQQSGAEKAGPYSPTSDPDRLAKDRLRRYLREELRRRKFQSTATDKELVAEALNTFLPDPNLFAEERFSYYWLNGATRGMRDIHTAYTIVPGTARIGVQPLTGDDLEHFNRLLLEDAFPRSLENIHRLRLAAIYQRIHETKQTALCLSGGGIRSGTFALGLLQGLARHGLLDKFHYLSTVSGGGYIGSWLSAWIHRHPSGLKGVTGDLANTTPLTKVDPDPDPIRFLRRYSSFITPKVGLLSADTWTFVGIYLRNLLLNWVVFIPLLLSVLILPRLIVALTIAPQQTTSWLTIPTPRGDFGLSGRHFFLAGGFVFVVWALTYIIFNRPTVREELRQASVFWRRQSTQRSFLHLCLLPLSLAAFCLTTYWAWSSQNKQLPKALSWFLIFGVLAPLFAWIIGSCILGRIRLRPFGINWKSLFSLDLVYLLVAGTVGGVLLWVLTYTLDPFGATGVWDAWSKGPAWSLLSWKTEFYVILAAPAFLLVFLLGATLYIGASSKSARIEDEDREWWSRLGAWVLIVILGWTIFTALVIFGPIALLAAPGKLASLGGISGVLAAVIGKSAKSGGTSRSSSQNGSVISSLMAAVMSKVLPLLAVVFIAILLVSLSLASTGLIRQLVVLASGLPTGITQFLTNAPLGFDSYLASISSNLPGSTTTEAVKFLHMHVLHLTSFPFVLVLGVVLLLVGIGISLRINLNIFSLHAGYRNRIIRAFLGASRPDHQRRPNPFTGFDPADNISINELRPGLFDEDDFPRAVDLATALLSHGDPNASNREAQSEVSDYLSKHGFLENLTNLADPSTFSIRLLAALRKDLNGALQDRNLHRKLSHLVPAEAESAPTSGDISLNRALFDAVFKDLIKARSSHEPYRLMHVVSTTLNLVGGDNLAWQQRKAEPFSVSPMYSGCFRLGYRDSRYYGGRDTGGISIGTAAAISGAAASSNMGYYTTSPVLSLVLTFFNVRLGWWLGNPGTAGSSTYDLRAPNSSVAPILDEALGLTDDKNKYVYLTDGGHFENLGLFEMVLRRCHVILVSDAAADGDYRFGDLGNAIRKVRIDLGIPIEFTAVPIFGSAPGKAKKGMYWAVGKIRYTCIDGKDARDGLLLYVKPAVYGDEPRDVLEYKESHPTFPHQSTADQFFDEPQFESYRILGSFVMDQMCGSDNDSLDLETVIGNAVGKLVDDKDGEAADPKLEDWWKDWQQGVASKE
jgi:hypothetical protein